ncbi:MAG: hypothetical protein Q7T25_14975, partial [Sideroxyarcus sp.]|nr:hypothetical protein [Sideroxyarcus sp.]
KNRMDPVRFLSRSLLKMSDNVLVKDGDFLIARSGQVGGIIGRGVWADQRFEGACVSVDVLRLSGAQSDVKAGYVFAFLCLTEVGYRQLIRGASGSSIPHISAADALNIKLPRCNKDIELKIDLLVRKAGRWLAQAQANENQAWSLIESVIEEQTSG